MKYDQRRPWLDYNNMVFWEGFVLGVTALGLFMTIAYAVSW